MEARKTVFLITAALLFLSSTNAHAVIDRTKYEKNRKAALENALKAVEKKGTVRARRPFLMRYDRNKDGVIDYQEAEAIRDFLKAAR